MHLLTGTDIINFHNGRDDLLILTTDGEFTTADHSAIVSSPHKDGQATAYDLVVLDDGTEAQVMVARSTINEGDWFPDALGDDGHLNASVADEMAAIINTDAGLTGLLQIHEIRETTAAWEKADQEANRLAGERAQRVAAFVQHCGGNQSEAARRLGLDQSTVNKLVRKAKGATAKTHNQGRALTAFDETRSIVEWARDPRCRVSYTTLMHRSAHLDEGQDAAEIITTPGHMDPRLIGRPAPPA
ncbi:hypothetical protein [Streptomyces sp. NPDC058872]|uniref:hypothetical protein n=1 Tax=Streptomyces sp. NPDC058872 TaxID=3346661 RepID=UPI0036B3DF3A